MTKDITITITNSGRVVVQANTDNGAVWLRRRGGSISLSLSMANEVQIYGLSVEINNEIAGG